jgi:hypothetical protein
MVIYYKYYIHTTDPIMSLMRPSSLTAHLVVRLGGDVYHRAVVSRNNILWWDGDITSFVSPFTLHDTVEIHDQGIVYIRTSETGGHHNSLKWSKPFHLAPGPTIEPGTLLYDAREPVYIDPDFRRRIF